ncbi:MAG: hypothetical protein WCW31_01035 [Patescibacteria group bacterium]|jgi:hypothetical protein
MKDIKPLIHKDTDNKSEEILQQEMQEYFDQNPALKFQAGLLVKIFELIKSSPENKPLAWWSYEHMRKIFPVSARITALEQRPVLRQKIVHDLTGLKLKTALKKYGTAEKQTDAIDAVLDDEDTTLDEFEAAFSPEVLAVYIFNETFWSEVRKALNNVIAESGPREKAFIAHLIERGLAHGLIDHKDIRSKLDFETWATKVPASKRSAVDRLRLKYEYENRLADFTSKVEMDIVGFDVLVESFDPSVWGPVIDGLGMTMGFNIEGVIVVEETSPKA